MLKPAVLALFSLCLATGNAQNLIIPQIADGGGWQTTIVLTNKSAILIKGSTRGTTWIIRFEPTEKGNRPTADKA